MGRGQVLGWTSMPKAVGIVAVAYVALDYLRETNGEIHARLQPLLWGFLAIALASRAPFYPHWKRELQCVGIFVSSLGFMLSALIVEAVAVQFVTTVLGLDWHWTAAPLPDIGQWLFLHLNEKLPTWMVTFLRAPVVGLHHFLILFLMLPFSVLYNCIEGPGMSLGARYMFTMGIGRLLRVMTFVATIIPSARPWCAYSRFRTARHPHPWAQKYYIPYTNDPNLVRQLLRQDRAFVSAGHYPPEYVPNWGRMQFLINLLRPPDPEDYPQIRGETWFSTLKRAGGGCNDLIYSGHIFVSVLTAMAWTEAYPGWTAVWVWLLVLHSAQREIRERHHYSVDVVAALYVGVLLWWMIGFFWKKRENDKSSMINKYTKNEHLIIKAAKDGDMEKIRIIVSDMENTPSENTTLRFSERVYVVSVLTGSFAVVLLAFSWTANG